MTFYESILLNIIYIILPLILYFFFIAYNKNIDREENNLILEIALFTSLYFSIRFGQNLDLTKIALVINIPLIIAYLNKKNIAIVVISFILILYQYKEFNLSYIFLLIEYAIYYFIYYLVHIKNKEKLFVIIFIIMKTIAFVISYKSIFDISIQFQIIILFIIETIIVLWILDKASNVLKYHMTIKELEQEKQIRTSLFKITHEIKNPLAVCKGYLDMLDIDDFGHCKKYIPIIKEEINKTLVLLQDFLSFTKIKIEPEILDVNLLLEESINNIKPLLDDKKITLIQKVSKNEAYVNGDYNRLCQVIINIIKNSIEALSNVNNPKISISSIKKKEQIEMIITDNGLGIEKSNLENIAKPFFTTKKDGTGLGVSMSFEIIKAHNGTIAYFSKENVGTKVLIVLPIEKGLD
ncbi:MAG: HAMP domain-containing sensor histidine kinase [Bacilli bacterium]